MCIRTTVSACALCLRLLNICIRHDSLCIRRAAHIIDRCIRETLFVCVHVSVCNLRLRVSVCTISNVYVCMSVWILSACPHRHTHTHTHTHKNKCANTRQHTHTQGSVTVILESFARSSYNWILVYSESIFFFVGWHGADSRHSHSHLDLPASNEALMPGKGRNKRQGVAPASVFVLCTSKQVLLYQ